MSINWRKLCTGLAVRGQRSWPLVGVESQPLLGGQNTTISIGKALRSIQCGCCRESGRSWESRCSEVSLYTRLVSFPRIPREAYTLCTAYGTSLSRERYIHHKVFLQTDFTT